MKIGLLLHLYQPLTQDSGVFHNIAESCYLPLIKLIKQKKDFHCTLNVNLSLLEQMEIYGYSNWIHSLKELVDSGRVEVTGCAAYHPLLTRIPEKLREDQIVLNEYALGYYLGRRTGFEGEPAILIKDLNGFFPPEMAVNEDLVRLLDELGYRWIMVDECAIPGAGDSNGSKNGVYTFKEYSTRLVARDRNLSNIVSFKRDHYTSDILSALNHGSTHFIALDGEVFGHHYSEGIYLLESLIDEVAEKGGSFMTVTEAMEFCDNRDTDTVYESTWGAVEADIENGLCYPMWDIPGNKLHKKIWEITERTLKVYREGYYSVLDEYETFPIWKLSNLSDIKDSQVQDDIRRQVLMMRALNSDQYWWASNKQMPDNKVLYDSNMIKKSMGFYKNYLDTLPENEEITEIKGLIDSLVEEVNLVENKIY